MRFMLMAMMLSGCGSSNAANVTSLDALSALGCGKDTDCKSDRICVNGECVEPARDGATARDAATIPDAREPLPDMARAPDLSPPPDMLPPLDMTPCGSNGQPCCGGTCLTPLTCDVGVCRSCGGEGQPCCANEVCHPTNERPMMLCIVNGVTCGSQTDRVCVFYGTCGTLNNPCCDDLGNAVSTITGHCRMGLRCGSWTIGILCDPCY